jgi:isovaleryl-CoA dehydrogenase
LPDLIAGKKIGALAITEPEAGSDALSLRCRADKKGDRYLLNGSKTFITNGPVADVAIFMPKPTRGRPGISAFIVEAFRVLRGKPMKKMGEGSPTGNCSSRLEVPRKPGEENRGSSPDERSGPGTDFWSMAPSRAGADRPLNT